MQNENNLFVFALHYNIILYLLWLACCSCARLLSIIWFWSFGNHSIWVLAHLQNKSWNINVRGEIITWPFSSSWETAWVDSRSPIKVQDKHFWPDKAFKRSNYTFSTKFSNLPFNGRLLNFMTWKKNHPSRQKSSIFYGIILKDILNILIFIGSWILQCYKLCRHSISLCQDFDQLFQSITLPWIIAYLAL